MCEEVRYGASPPPPIAIRAEMRRASPGHRSACGIHRFAFLITADISSVAAHPMPRVISVRLLKDVFIPRQGRHVCSFLRELPNAVGGTIHTRLERGCQRTDHTSIVQSGSDHFRDDMVGVHFRVEL